MEAAEGGHKILEEEITRSLKFYTSIPRGVWEVALFG
jgi:hypothetical protein